MKPVSSPKWDRRCPSREHYWVQGAPEVLLLSILPLLPGPRCSCHSPPTPYPLQQDPAQGRQQTSAWHQGANPRAMCSCSGGLSSLLRGISLRVTKSYCLMFSNSSDERRDLNLPAPMDLEKTQGFQRPIQGKVIFHLHCLLGNALRLLKLLEEPDFP